MGIFIRVEIDESRCDTRQAARLIDVCPVNVFLRAGDHVTTDAENEDECTLCGLCLSVCPPSAVTIRRLYRE